MKYRYIISSILFAVVLFGLSLAAWLKPADAYSDSERRPFDQFPEVSVENILSGKFTSEFEGYATDQFPLRDDFRTLKAIAKFYLFNQKDNNDIYIHNGHASKLETDIKDTSVNNAITKITALYESLVKGKTDKVYLSVVPDKSLTLAEDGNYPALDYNKIAEAVKNGIDWAEYIDIYPLLDYNDYYKTDTHWSQEKIVDVAEKLANAMGASVEKDYDQITLDKDFFGVYYGQSSLPLPPDKITYLNSPVIDGCLVYNYEKDNGKTAGKVYDMEKLDSKDPYEMFLSGASALLRIVNPANESGRRLIVFRDSYTSSLAPLLVESYSEVILIDTRYILPAYVSAFVSPEEFTDADVLFIYSAMILNNSETLK